MKTGRLTALLAAMVAAPLAMGDTIRLHNGDVLTGVVTDQTDEAVTLDHPVLGAIVVPMADVASLQRAGEAAAAEAPASAEQGPESPEVPPGTPAIATTPEPDADASPEAAPAPEPPVDDHNGLLGLGIFVGWDSSFAAGFTGSSGNSDALAINAQFKTQFEDDSDRWIWNSTYFLSEDSGKKSRNEFKSELTRDWLSPDTPWFLFVQGVYEYDEFQAWKHRASGFGGVGYTFLKSEKVEFNGRLGAGLTKEFSGSRDLTPEALVSAALVRYKITESQSLMGSVTLYPDLGDVGEFRAVAGLEYQIKIDHADGLSLKLGFENEYESEVEDGTKHNDLKYYGALVYDF